MALYVHCTTGVPTVVDPNVTSSNNGTASEIIRVFRPPADTAPRPRYQNFTGLVYYQFNVYVIPQLP